MIESTENIYLAESRSPEHEEALESCMDMIHKISHRCKGGRIAFEDLVADASLAVLESLHSYDPSKGCSFKSYAMFRIRKAVFRHMDSFSRPFSVSWRASSEEFDCVSTDILAETPASDTFNAEYDIAEFDEREFLRSCLNTLSERERRVIDLRFGLSGEAPLSCAALAGKLGISGEGVRKIEERSIGRLREELLPEYI